MASLNETYEVKLGDDKIGTYAGYNGLLEAFGTCSKYEFYLEYIIKIRHPMNPDKVMIARRVIE